MQNTKLSVLRKPRSSAMRWSSRESRDSREMIKWDNLEAAAGKGMGG